MTAQLARVTDRVLFSILITTEREREEEEEEVITRK
jgi:hypothetical protein